MSAKTDLAGAVVAFVTAELRKAADPSKAAPMAAYMKTTYERMIREGAWWDFVDDLAIRCVGRVLRENRSRVRDVMDEWIVDDDLWIRRTAIISQVGHKNETDWRRLSRYCRQRAGETEFFIRKAIGWALRDYSYTEPERVADFLEDHREMLSGLSFREGAKALRRDGWEL